MTSLIDSQEQDESEISPSNLELVEKEMQKQSKWMDTLKNAEKLIEDTQPDSDSVSDSEVTAQSHSHMTDTDCETEDEEEEEEEEEEEDFHGNFELLYRAYNDQRQENLNLRNRFSKMVEQVRKYKEDLENQNEELSEQILQIKNKLSDTERKVKELQNEKMEMAQEFEEAKEEYMEEIDQIKEQHRTQQKEQIVSLQQVFEEVEFVGQRNEELLQESYKKDETIRDLQKKLQTEQESVLELKRSIVLSESKHHNDSKNAPEKIEQQQQQQQHQNAQSGINMPNDQRILQINALLQKALGLATLNDNTSDGPQVNLMAEDLQNQLDKEKKAHERDIEALAFERKRLQDEREYISSLNTRTRDLSIKLNLSDGRAFHLQDRLRESLVFLGLIRNTLDAVLRAMPSDWIEIAPPPNNSSDTVSKKNNVFFNFLNTNSQLTRNSTDSHHETATASQNVVETFNEFQDKWFRQVKSLKNSIRLIDEHLQTQSEKAQEQSASTSASVSQTTLGGSGSVDSTSTLKPSLARSPSFSFQMPLKTANTLTELGASLSAIHPKRELTKKSTIGRAEFRLLQMKSESVEKEKNQLDEEIDVGQVGKKMGQELELFEKTFGNTTFRTCFENVLAINWMLKKLTSISSRSEAVTLAKRMISMGLIAPCEPNTEFEEGYPSKYFHFPGLEKKVPKDAPHGLMNLFVPPSEQSGTTKNSGTEESHKSGSSKSLHHLERTARFRSHTIDTTAQTEKEKQVHHHHKDNSANKTDSNNKGKEREKVPHTESMKNIAAHHATPEKKLEKKVGFFGLFRSGDRRSVQIQSPKGIQPALEPPRSPKSATISKASGAASPKAHDKQHSSLRKGKQGKDNLTVISEPVFDKRFSVDVGSFLSSPSTSPSSSLIHTPRGEASETTSASGSQIGSHLVPQLKGNLTAPEQPSSASKSFTEKYPTEKPSALLASLAEQANENPTTSTPKKPTTETKTDKTNKPTPETKTDKTNTPTPETKTDKTNKPTPENSKPLQQVPQDKAHLSNTKSKSSEKLTPDEKNQPTEHSFEKSTSRVRRLSKSEHIKFPSQIKSEASDILTESTPDDTNKSPNDKSAFKKTLSKKESGKKRVDDLFVDPTTCYCEIKLMSIETVTEKNNVKTPYYNLKVTFHETSWSILRDYNGIYKCAKWIPKLKFEKKLLTPSKHAKKPLELVATKDAQLISQMFEKIVENREEIFKKYRSEFLNWVVPIGVQDRKPENFFVPFKLF